MANSDNQIIEPSAFTRADAPTKAPFFKPSPLKVSVLIVFIALATVALFMFNARAVQFILTPDAAEFRIKGGLPTYQLGERFLMLRGDYKISAEAEGYYRLDETVTVGEDPDQEYSFELSKLPGIVTVEAWYADTQIEGAEVFIDQELVGVTPLVIDEVPAGKRDLYVNHPRFRSAQTEIDVIGLRERQTETMQMEPSWADVRVSTVPEGEEIFVENERLGETPKTVEVIEGTRTLLVRKKGFKSFETTLSVVAQEDLEVPAIILIKSDGKLNIDSEPSRVNVTISGRYYGQTPLSLALPPKDRYELVATKAGYQNFSRSLSVKPDEDQSLNLSLKPILGQVKLAVSPSGANLFVNDKARGSANQTLELTARSHNLRVELEGYATFETRVIPQPGLPQQLNIVLQTEEEARVSAIPQQITTSLGDTLRFIIPGEMQMGAGRREPGRRSNEVQKDVTLTRAFYLAEKEISNETFKAFDPGHDSGLLGRALLSDPERPVVNVSWNDAVRFCNWLSEQDGLPLAYEQKDGKWQLRTPVTTGYRLPTEAEWAWSARYADGMPTRFPWGDNMPPSPGFGNFADESAANMVPYSIKGYNDNYRGPAPSGTYGANDLGIFDLAGNVSEWISDLYSVELHRKPLIDPLGPEHGDYYVIRGSNYTHGRFSELRWTFRDYGLDPRPDVGFRIARFSEAE
ncbi:MAG: PEGA domain-containing protein [Pseudomonadales bacterium]|nr:PEGA domain-containing protein [Pseudomonadales bacterium]